MRIFQHQSQIVQSSNGNIQRAFKVVKGNDEKMMKMEGVSNRGDPSLFHIIQTLRKNHMSAQRYYTIHEDDILDLLKEGERKKDIESMKNYKSLGKVEEKKKSIKKRVEKKVEKKKVEKKSAEKKKRHKKILLKKEKGKSKSKK